MKETTKTSVKHTPRRWTKVATRPGCKHTSTNKTHYAELLHIMYM